MYLKRSAIIIITIIVSAVAIGAVLDNVYRKRWSLIFFEKTDELIHSKRFYDVVFLGDSRVHFGINPYYFDSATTLNSYNFGYGGADAEEIMMVTNILLARHPAPKLAVVSLSLGCMTKNETLKTRFHDLYYLGDDTIRKYMNNAGFLTGMMRVAPFTKYSFFDEYNRTSLFVKGNTIPEFDHNIHKGFLNIHPHMNSEATYLYNIDGLWAPAVGYFETTVQALVDKGCKVVIVTAPERSNSIYRTSAFRYTVDSVFNRVALKYHVPFLHFEKDTISYPAGYFVDDVHLNEPGTRIFSRQLADSLMKYFPKL